MRLHANWHAFDGKVEGDEIQLVMCEAGYGREGEQLVMGTVGKCTKTTRRFDMPGSWRIGEIRFGANMRSPSEEPGLIIIGETRYWFEVATPAIIARLTDPNRGLREELDEALSDFRWSARRAHALDKEGVSALIAELETARHAAKALHDAL